MFLDQPTEPPGTPLLELVQAEVIDLEKLEFG